MEICGTKLVPTLDNVFELGEISCTFILFCRPTQSSFTRAQRIASVFCALFLTMICSAMFYKSEEDVDRPTVATIGPFTITMQELFVSCITAAIVFPITLFIAYVFRNSNKMDRARQKDMAKERRSDVGYIDIDDIDLLLGEMYRESVETDTELKEGNLEKEPSGMKRCCDRSLLISAWITATLAILVSAFFVILYSMEWGAEKSNAWLVSYILSFVENAFFADPMKVRNQIYFNLSK